jgi:hypothetical protein|eukprot:COSAG01_NODE_886_length_12921_cov_115.252652_1_plen_163_part_00
MVGWCSRAVRSNEKDLWVNDSPMTCMERLVEQAKLIKDINPDTKIWVYRESVAAQPWYTDVRQKLTNPKTAHWFLKFNPNVQNYSVPKCDTSFQPPRCSDLYHDQVRACWKIYHEPRGKTLRLIQVQTPHYPSGDGACNKAYVYSQQGYPCLVACSGFCGDL